MINYFELIDKDIINIRNGENIGKFSDVEIDTKRGKLTVLYINESGKLFNLFKNSQHREIKWDQIVKVGMDVIVVDCDCEYTVNESRNRS